MGATINSGISLVVETAVNKVLSLDTDSQKALSELCGKIIQVELTDLNVSLIFSIESQNGVTNISVSNSTEATPNVKLSGTGFAFFNMGWVAKNGDAIFKGDVHFNGEINTAQKFQNVFQNLNIDWEAELAKVTGDQAAHVIGQFMLGFHNQAKHFAKTFVLNLSEYATEESRMAVHKEEIESFYDDLADLKADIGRTEARINRIKNQVQ